MTTPTLFDLAPPDALAVSLRAERDALRAAAPLAVGERVEVLRGQWNECRGTVTDRIECDVSPTAEVLGLPARRLQVRLHGYGVALWFAPEMLRRV